MNARRTTAVAYALTALTGAAGLIYQLAWQRYLARLLGSDTLATATVLGLFLAGLSVGLLLWGRLTEGDRNLFVLYGRLEAAVGIWALLFPWLFAAVDRMTASWEFEPQLGLIFQGTLATLLLIGLPTICMGATVPMLTRALTLARSGATRVNAMLYACNTAGAVVGTIAAGYLSIRYLGLPATVRLAGLLNLAAAIYFVRAGRRIGAPADAGRAKQTNDPASLLPRLALLTVGFVGGFAFMTLESSVIRLAGLSVGSSTYTLSLVVAAFLSCIAGGAWIAGLRRNRSATALLTNQIAASVGLMAIFWTLDDWPYLAHQLRIRFGQEPVDFLGYQAALFVGLCLLLALPVGCMGATLPLAFDAMGARLQRVGRAAGALFGWNAIGNLLGGLLGGYLAFRFLTLGEVFLLALILVALTTLPAAARAGRTGKALAGLTLAASCLFAWIAPSHDLSRFAVGTFRLQQPLDYSHERAPAFYRKFLEGRTIVAYTDDPEATVAVVENPRLAEALRNFFPSLGRSIVAAPSALGESGPRPRSIVINGKADSSTFYDREALRLMAHLPALLASRRERVLVVGLGTGVTAGELALYPDVDSIEVAEISPGVARMLPHFADWTHKVHEDPRLTLRIGDAFRILRRSEGRWDLIVSQPSNPWTSGGDQLFSRDFYRLVRERLALDGLFVSWMQRYSTNDRIIALTLNALRAEFPHVRLFRVGSDDLMLASLQPVTDDDFLRADATLAGNPRAAASLAEIRITSAADLLARERLDIFEEIAVLEHLGVESLDRPRIHFLAGRAFFAGDDPDIEHGD